MSLILSYVSHDHLKNLTMSMEIKIYAIKKKTIFFTWGLEHSHALPLQSANSQE